MVSWQGKAFKPLLHRVMRARLERCRTIDEMRRVIEGIDRLGSFINQPPDIQLNPFAIGDLPCSWVERPGCQQLGVLLYFPGGGFCFRSPMAHNAVLARLSSQSGLRGLMVNYPLAPEQPFPAAVNACLLAYRWLLAHGFPPSAIALGGDSAGANLVLTTLMQLRDAGEPQPAAAVLLSPAVDMVMTGATVFERHDSDPFFAIATLLLLRNNYIGHHNPWQPLISPLVGELHQLAPLMIHVGEDEVLLDDAVRLAAKVESSGGKASLTAWPGMPHVFPIFNQLPEAQQALAACGRFLRSHITPLRQPPLAAGKGAVASRDDQPLAVK